MAKISAATPKQRKYGAGLIDMVARQNPQAADKLAGARASMLDPNVNVTTTNRSSGEQFRTQVAPALAGLAAGPLGGAIAGGMGSLGATVASKIPGLTALTTAAKGVRDLMPSGTKIPGLEEAGGYIRDKVFGGDPITLGTIGDKIGSAAKKGVEFVKERPEMALAAAQGVYGVSRANAADDARKTALSIAGRSWDERDPLRRAGVAGMLNTTRPSLPEFDDPTNPFAQGSRPSTTVPPGEDPAMLMRGRKRPLSMRG